jgi:ribosomal protein RSM22 (predicted rRNA methylase)
MHYAEARFVLDQLDRLDFEPESILDYGSGVGGVFWAARQKWNHCLKDYSMVDPNEKITHFAMDIMRVSFSIKEPLFKNKFKNQKTGNLCSAYVNFRRTITGSSERKYDLVIAQRVLTELDSHEARTELLKLLWKRTNKYLVLIEAHTKEHFEAIMYARDFLLVNGTKFDTKALKANLIAKGLLTEEIEEMFDNPNASLLEKCSYLRRNEIDVETAVEPGYVVAPCPHDSGCPMLTTENYR